jgi:hypothetical protein
MNAGFDEGACAKEFGRAGIVGVFGCCEISLCSSNLTVCGKKESWIGDACDTGDASGPGGFIERDVVVLFVDGKSMGARERAGP